MTIKEFFQKYNGIGVDFDGYYGFQCVDLYRQYVKEVLNFEQSPSLGNDGAYKIWDNYRKSDFDSIGNTPQAVPQLGDIIIWSKSARLPYGHISVFNYGDVNSFVSFDQNFPTGSTCHFQNHNYEGILGWLRPKDFDFTEVEITDKTKIDMGEHWGIMEVQAIKSTLKDQIRTIENLNEKMKDQKIKCEERISALKEKSAEIFWMDLFSIIWEKVQIWKKKKVG